MIYVGDMLYHETESAEAQEITGSSESLQENSN